MPAFQALEDDSEKCSRVWKIAVDPFHPLEFMRLMFFQPADVAVGLDAVAVF